MIKVVHCVDTMVGGVASVLLAYAEACHDLSFNFISISPVEDSKRDRVESFGGRLVADGVEGPALLENAITAAKASTGAKIFHVHRNWHNLRPAILARKAGYDVVISHSHNVFPSSSHLKDVYHALFKALIKRYVDASWGCSPEAISFLYGPKPKNPLFVPNPVSFSSFRFSEKIRSEKRRELGLENSFVLVHAGLPIPQKNHPFLLRVFAEVLKARPESRLLLLGPDEEEDAWLHDLAIRLGVVDSVAFCGYVKDVADYYAAGDLFVFPSFNEGLSVALLEAQANGLSFIASESVSRCSDLFGNGCFLSVDGGVGPWVARITSFESGRRVPSAESVRTCRFNIDNAAPALSATYKALLDGASQRDINLIWDREV